MKLLVDMNLTPSWVDGLARHGFEPVHWSTIGAPTAPDVEILTWANGPAFVLITNDLDVSAILAAGEVERRRASCKSELRICSPDVVVSIVAKALDVHREDIERGALL